MKDLYEELKAYKNYLKTLEQTEEVKGQLTMLREVIIRVQQRLLERPQDPHEFKEPKK